MQIQYEQGNQTLVFYWVTLKSSGESDITAFFEVFDEPSTGTREINFWTFPDVLIESGKEFANLDFHWPISFTSEQAEEKATLKLLNNAIEYVLKKADKKNIIDDTDYSIEELYIVAIDVINGDTYYLFDVLLNVDEIPSDLLTEAYIVVKVPEKKAKGEVISYVVFNYEN